MIKFKKIVGLIAAFLGRAGVFFTATILIFNVFVAGSGRSFSPDFFGVALLFGALLALCGFVLKLKFIPSELAKGAIHVFLATASFVVSIILSSGVKTTTSAAFIMAVIFAVADVAVLSVRGLYLHAVKKAEQKAKNEGEESK